MTIPDDWTWEDWIESLRTKGWDDDEIVHELDRVARPHGSLGYRRRTRSGESWDWSRLHDRKRIEQLIGAPAAPEPGPVAEGPMLSREDVVDARRRWQQGKTNARGQGNPWDLADVSESTYIRARRRYGLVPWPKELKTKTKLTP